MLRTNLVDNELQQVITIQLTQKLKEALLWTGLSFWSKFGHITQKSITIVFFAKTINCSGNFFSNTFKDVLSSMKLKTKRWRELYERETDLFKSMDCSIKCSRKSLKKKSRSGVKSLLCQCVRRRAQQEGFFQYRSGSGRILKKSRVEMLKYSIGYSRVPHFSRVFPGMLSMSCIKGKLDISG